MRSLRTSVAIGGMALLMVSGAGCGKILSKAGKEGVKAATKGSVNLDSGVKLTQKDSNGLTCSQNFNDSGVKAKCVDSNGDTVASGKVDSNGASGNIKDSNGDTCSGSVGSDTGSGTCTDSKGDTTATGSYNSDSGGVTVSGDSGNTTFSSGTGRKLPAGWPSEANPPNGADVQLSIKNADSSEIVFAAKGTTVDKVFNSYDSHLKSAGWKRTSNSDINGNKIAEYTKGDQTLTVSIATTGSTSGVTGTIAINKTNS